MALVTDGNISTIDDLRALDSAILDTSRIEGIDLAQKLQLANEAIQLELAVFLLRATSQNNGTGPGVDLSNVLVTTPLRRWHSLRTLVEVYSDAYNSQFNDRYLGKWKHYAKLTRETSDLLFDYGVGVSRHPVPQPPAPVVEPGGEGAPAGQYYVRTAWRNQLGTNGALSPPVVFTAANGERMSVNPGPAPAGVTGFDVFAGSEQDQLTRQTPAGAALGTAWLQPAAALINGTSPGAGQKPDYYIRRSRSL